jgi:hypothetical protein
MNQDLINNQQWVDIITPPPPESHLLLAWSAILTLAIILLLALAYFWQKRPVQIARRRIRRLLQKMNTGDTTNRQILAELVKLLCERYTVSQISAIKIEDAYWQEFFQQLTSACYQSSVPDNEKTTRLLIQAMTFLKLTDK